MDESGAFYSSFAQLFFLRSGNCSERLRLINRLLRFASGAADSGILRIRGRDVVDFTVPERRAVSSVIHTCARAISSDHSEQSVLRTSRSSFEEFLTVRYAHSGITISLRSMGSSGVNSFTVIVFFFFVCMS